MLGNRTVSSGLTEVRVAAFEGHCQSNLFEPALSALLRH